MLVAGETTIYINEDLIQFPHQFVCTQVLILAFLACVCAQSQGYVY